MKMKKIAAIIFSAAMVLNMGAAAMAEGSATPSFEKIYNVTGGNVTPSETLEFEVTPVEGNPGNEMITIADTPVTGNAAISIGFPEGGYAKVGKYNYTVKEKAGNTQGVTYSETTFSVQVLVTNDINGDGIKETELAFTSGETGNKVDEIVNEYGLGSLTVSKKVSGNLASSEQPFDIHVKFTAENGKKVGSAINYGGNQTIGVGDWNEGVAEVVISIRADQEVTFNNIPAGVTYTVTEDEKYKAPDGNGANSAAGYTVSYKESNPTKVIVAGAADTVEITNEKGTTVDTGINLDSMPYIMILALVAVCAVVMFARKRFSANR